MAYFSKLWGFHLLHILADTCYCLFFFFKSTILETCFMAQHLVYPGECSMSMYKDVFCSHQLLYRFLLGQMGRQCSSSLLEPYQFCLVALPTVKSGILNSLTVTDKLSISTILSVYASDFGALFLGAYTFMTGTSPRNIIIKCRSLALVLFFHLKVNFI